MKAESERLINKYLNFSGRRVFMNFTQLYGDLVKAQQDVKKGTMEYKVLDYIKAKTIHGADLAVIHDVINVIVDEDSVEDIIEAIKESEGLIGKVKSPKSKTKKKSLGKVKPKAKKSLGKIVDEGEVPEGRSDQYWRGSKKPKIIFTPGNSTIRSGLEIPSSYRYDDVRFIENHYGLRGIEFGNWLSQQDRRNYVAGLGIALFDLYHAIGFAAKDLSIKGKITVAFGARGRGAMLAHFEPSTFAINITRYRRPEKKDTKKKNFDRTDLLIASGGVGSYAHEFAHALDYYGGTFVEKDSSGALSKGQSTRLTPDKKLLNKNSLQGLMEKLLYKILWQKEKKESPYYARLKKSKQTKYFFRRNEIFARAFEVYVQYKMQTKKYKNIFLAETKYDQGVYLSLPEMKKLEGDFDQLMNALKRKL